MLTEKAWPVWADQVVDEVLVRRLLGAAVLLSAAFALASLLPDPARPPPAEGKQRVVTYDLTTGRPVGEAADRAPAPEPEPAATAPRDAVQLQESLALSPLETWYVQVGSFGNQTNARSVLVKLYELGMPTTIETVQVKKDLWYRVRVGPYTAENKAREALAAIRKQGYDEAKLVHIDG